MDPYYFQSLASCHEASSELALRDAPLSSDFFHAVPYIARYYNNVSREGSVIGSRNFRSREQVEFNQSRNIESFHSMYGRCL
jgi:hypothetical protein